MSEKEGKIKEKDEDKEKEKMEKEEDKKEKDEEGGDKGKDEEEKGFEIVVEIEFAVEKIIEKFQIIKKDKKEEEESQAKKKGVKKGSIIKNIKLGSEKVDLREFFWTNKWWKEKIALENKKNEIII